MKALLLNPPFLPRYSRNSRSPAVTKSGTIYYPVWLSYACGLLEQNGHEVLLLDAPAAGKSLNDYKERIVKFAPGIVVLDTSTPSIENDAAAATQIKSWFGGQVKVVLVGTHPTACAEEVLTKYSEVDYIAAGEHDWTLLELAYNGGNGDGVAGIIRREKGEVKANSSRPFSNNLDELPFVSSVYKKHLDINNYFYAHCKNPVISVFAGRGCPNRCSFCVYPQVIFGNAYRHRSAKNLADELEYISKEFAAVKEVLIDDDNFTSDRKFLVDVCDEIIKRKIKVTWTAEARVGLEFEIMKKMKAAGCRLLVAGFESADERVLNAMQKGIKIADSEKFIADAKKAGLRVHGCFVIGSEHDTAESVNKSINWALSQPLDTAQFFPLMVYPGTKSYDWAKSHGYIKAATFREWLTPEGLHNCVISTDTMTADEIVSFCDLARKKFYLRPKYMFYKLMDVVLNPSELSRTVKAALRLFRHILK